jgi:hypothetical protein
MRPLAIKGKITLRAMRNLIAEVGRRGISARNGEAGSPIQRRLEDIKANKDDHANSVEGGSFPVEMDLDLCRHF